MRGIFFIFIFILSHAIKAQLNGTYTIGGTSPNYATLTAAANALNTLGISGNVTFNIRPGTYNERINIQSVPGNNASRTILFKAENNDSASVVIATTSASNIDNYVVAVQNTQNVQFSRLTFKGPSSGSYGIVFSIYIVPGFKLQRCRVSGITTTTATAANQDVIQFSGGTGYEISNSTIRGGYRGIGIYGGETVPVNNVLISNNRFFRSSSAGIRAQFSHNLQFTRNVIDSCGASGFLAAQIAFCSTAVVTLNRIDLDGGGGLGFTSCYSTNAARTKVNNNFVSVSGNAPGSGGINLQDMRFADVYYNSFNIQVFDSYQVYVLQISNGGTGLRIQNNSFVTNPGNAIVNNIGSENALQTYSYNNLFNGEPQSNLPPNSFSFNPGYTSSSDLHLIPSNLNAKGTPVEITTDIDGQTRNASTPDIGADEFTPNLRSAGINQLLNPSPDSVYCSSMPLTFELINSGSIALSSVQFEVDFNGTLSSHTWNGTLASGQSTVVDLGDFLLTPISANNLIVYITAVNGLSDEYATDDIAFFSDIYQALNGEYTLGGSTPSFNSFSAAVLRLQQGGVCGPVTFKVRNGTYFERIYLNPVKGASTSNFILFEGESQDSSLVSIVSSGTSSFPSTVRLVEVRYMGFRHMSILQNASTSNYAAFHSTYGSDILIDRCSISGFTSSTSSSSTHAFVAFPDSNLTITRTLISGGNSIACNLVGTGPMKYNLIFEYNTVYGGTDDGLDVRNWTHASIKHNRLFGGYSNTTYAVYGLGLIDFDFSYNKVSAGGAQGSSALYLINNGSGTLGVRNRISNNVLSCNLGVDVIAVGMCMRIISTNNTDIFHNTIRHNSLDTDNFAVNLSNSSGLDIRNNIFANAGTGITMAYNNISNSTCDYNVYYTGGNVLIGLTNDLAAVQTITGGDEHSLVANPNFYSTQLDSMFFTNPLLENMGGLCSVTDDIRGFPRQIPNPDPGAFESPSAPNVSLGADTAVCGAYILDGTTVGAESYVWNTGATSPQILIESSGTYILTASNAIGSSSDTLQISVMPVPTAVAMNDTAVCEGSLIQLSGSGSNGSCTWLNAAGNLVGNTCVLDSINALSTYIFSIENAGCIGYDTVTITLIPLPETPVISASGNYLYATGSGAITWYLNGSLLEGNTVDSLEINASGIYTAVRTNLQGCSAISDDYSVTITQNTLIAENVLLQISPNPNLGSEWQISGVQFNDWHYYLIASDGKIVSSGVLQNTLSAELLCTGIYRLIVFNGKNEYVHQANLIKVND